MALKYLFCFQGPKSVASIFGVSGTNVVKVDTPAFNYGYQFGN